MKGYAPSIILFVVVTIASTFGLRLIEAAYDLGGGAIVWHQLGPLVGALAVALLVPATTKPDPPAPVGRKQWLAHTILGVAAAAVFALLVWAGFSLLQVPAVDFSRADFATVVIALFGALIGAVAQEIGWRGSLQPILESRMPRIGAVVIVGMLWALWHVSAYTDVFTALLLFATYVPLGILFGYLGNGSATQRVITTALVHWLVMMSVSFLAGVSGTLTMIVVAAAACIVTAVFMAMFVVASKRRARAAAAAPVVESADSDD